MPVRKRLRRTRHILIIALLMLYLLQGCQQNPRKRPNIVLIYIDDMGYGDIVPYGATQVQTPHLTQLADQGMRFTDFYVTHAVSSASRASLLTGCYANRVGVFGAYSPWSKKGLHPQETTLAELLSTQGYATGIFGKWHLGHHREFLPLQQGFDEYLGLPYSNDMWPIDYNGQPLSDSSDWKFYYPPLPLIQGNQPIDTIATLHDQGQLTRRYTQAAMQFIDRHADEPFFLYLPHSMVHVPIAASEAFRGTSRQGLYGDVVAELDWSVGQILKQLAAKGLSENTLVIFTSDNGPWLNYGAHAGSTAGLREGKGTSFEGGVKVPALMRWPGHIPAGSVCNQLASTLDILPTVAALAGAPLPQAPIDGVNILPLLQGDTSVTPRTRLYYYYQGGELQAVRHKQWKLVFPHVHRSYVDVQPGKNGYPGPYAFDTAQYALYNLRRDPGERYNVHSSHPRVVQQLEEIAQAAREELGDKLQNRTGSGTRPAGKIAPRPNELGVAVNHLAKGLEPILKHPYAEQYSGGSPHALTDGWRAPQTLAMPADYSLWQGFHQHPLHLTVDLGHIQPIRHLSIGFMHYIRSWIFRPTSVTFYGSADGQQFTPLGTYQTTIPLRSSRLKRDHAQISCQTKARYIRVIAHNVGQCPPWHSGAGGKAWLFADELIVNPY